MSSALASAGEAAAPPQPSLPGRLAGFLTRHESLSAGLALAAFALSAVYFALVRPLWFDEIFTALISRLPSLRSMLQAMPADSQPPLQYVVTHVSLRWLGTNALALRLPEMLAYLAAGVFTWRIVRRHGTPVQGLFGLVFFLGASTTGLWTSGFALDGLSITARPYELLLAGTAAAFFFWQAATLRTRGRFLHLTGLSVSLAVTILSHHFGIVQIGLFVGAGEAVRFLQRRRVDLPVLAAFAAGCLPLAITVPLAQRTHQVLGVALRHSLTFWAKPKLEDLFSWPFFAPLLLLVPVLVLVLLSGEREGGTEAARPAVPPHELAAAGALALLLPLQLLIATAATGYFLARYAVGTALGLTLVVCWFGPRWGRLRALVEPAFATLATTYMVTVVLALAIAQVRHPLLRARPTAASVAPLLLDAPADLPIVAANSFDSLAEWWYAPGGVRARLVYLDDVPYAMRGTAALPELSLVASRLYLPLAIKDYAPYLKDHGHFLLLAAGPPECDWITARLARAGWHMTPLARTGGGELYDVRAP